MAPPLLWRSAWHDVRATVCACSWRGTRRATTRRAAKAACLPCPRASFALFSLPTAPHLWMSRTPSHTAPPLRTSWRWACAVPPAPRTRCWPLRGKAASTRRRRKTRVSGAGHHRRSPRPSHGGAQLRCPPSPRYNSAPPAAPRMLHRTPGGTLIPKSAIWIAVGGVRGAVVSSPPCRHSPTLDGTHAVKTRGGAAREGRLFRTFLLVNKTVKA